MAVVIGMSSCKQGGQSKETQLSEAEKEFEEFYQRFHEDSLYQINHIQFPVRMIYEETTIEIDTMGWKMNRLDGEGMEEYDYQRRWLDETLVEDFFVHKTLPFALERRFGKIGNEWLLIKYHEHKNLSPE